MIWGAQFLGTHLWNATLKGSDFQKVLNGCLLEFQPYKVFQVGHLKLIVPFENLSLGLFLSLLMLPFQSVVKLHLTSVTVESIPSLTPLLAYIYFPLMVSVFHRFPWPNTISLFISSYSHALQLHERSLFSMLSFLFLLHKLLLLHLAFALQPLDSSNSLQNPRRTIALDIVVCSKS